MPIYEFSCQDCSQRFEYLMRSSNEEIVCPKCGRKKLRKLISSFAFASRDSAGNVTASSSGCGGCASRNCSSCRG